MKATGIVRKIDDLGRIVIPKEIRRTLFIKEGDPLEIYVDGDGGIIFKKYSPVKEMGELTDNIACGISKACGSGAVIFDRDEVTSYCGVSRDDICGKMSAELARLSELRRPQLCEGQSVPLIESGELLVSALCPIIANGDVVGCVVTVRGDEECKSGELEAVGTAAFFLGRHLSD